ncbi:TolC family protein [Roseivirga sp.]|uniref:TolC family protein n=1 Tax=Roseivirga sp. TaxID=1964215 RepID=UPI003B8B5F46
MRRFNYIILLLIFSTAAYAQMSLNDYLKIAAEENPMLKAKFKMYMAALEKVNQTGSLPDPTLTFGYFISPVETRVGAQKFRLAIAQMFPWMGTLKARERASASLAKVQFEAFQEAKSELFYQVQTKWLAIYVLRRELSIMSANLEILRTFEPVTKTKYEANLVSLADLIRVQINIENAETELEIAKMKEGVLISDFNTSINRSPESPVITAPFSVLINEDVSSEDSLFNQPRIKAIKANIQSMTDAEVLADLRRKPNIGFGLEYGFVSKRSGVTLSDNGKDILLPTVSMSLPIFGKKNRSFKKEAVLKRESFEAELVSVKNDLKNEWNSVAFEKTSAEKQLEKFQSEIEKVEVLLNVLTSEYSNNNRDFETLLSTQQRLLQLQLAQINAQAQLQKTAFKKGYLTSQTLNQIR